MERKEPTIGPIAFTETEGQSIEPSRRRTLKPRRPAVAALLGLLLPAAAFAYVGRPFAVLLLHFGLIAALATLGWSGWIQSVAGAYTLYALVVAYFVACMVLPWRFARRSGRAFVAKWYNRWYVYLLYGVVIGIPTAHLLLNKQRYFGFANYRTPSSAMEPTLQIGDVFMVDTRPDTVASVKAGDVVVFGSWKNPDVIYVKRLIALPGQRVTFGANGALVDGQPVSRESVHGSDLMSAVYMRYTDTTLGSNELYVMGDNRGNSFDSRTEGPVQRSALRGKVTAVFWSSHATPLGQVAGTSGAHQNRERR